MLPSEIPKLPTDPPVRGFPGVWKLLLFHDSLPGMGLHPYLFCLSFYLLYFVLPPFEDSGLPFWVPGVLCQCSEVVLWNLLSVQMTFRWICRGEGGLPVLFLCHLGTTSLPPVSSNTVNMISFHCFVNILQQLLWIFSFLSPISGSPQRQLLWLAFFPVYGSHVPVSLCVL